MRGLLEAAQEAQEEFMIDSHFLQPFFAAHVHGQPCCWWRLLVPGIDCK